MKSRCWIKLKENVVFKPVAAICVNGIDKPSGTKKEEPRRLPFNDNRFD